MNQKEPNSRTLAPEITPYQHSAQFCDRWHCRDKILKSLWLGPNGAFPMNVSNTRHGDEKSFALLRDVDAAIDAAIAYLSSQQEV